MRLRSSSGERRRRRGSTRVRVSLAGSVRVPQSATTQIALAVSSPLARLRCIARRSNRMPEQSRSQQRRTCGRNSTVRHSGGKGTRERAAVQRDHRGRDQELFLLCCERTAGRRFGG